MNKQGFLLFIATILGVLSLKAQIYDGSTQQEAPLSQALMGVQPGTIVLLGESHGLTAHQDQHIKVLEYLRNLGLKVSVGLEFLNYPDQDSVNQYRAGVLAQDDFLKKINWGGIDFNFYKKQLDFPLLTEGAQSVALNLPRAISSKISKQGLESLTPDELQILPPQFEVGRDSYKERFSQAAGAHCPSLDRCFAAQSAWDDTMAWQALNFIGKNPDQVLVIVVGEFHVQFGGGLGHRIQVRNPQVSVRTISQIWAEGATDEEIKNELKPSEIEGPRADFIWVSKP